MTIYDHVLDISWPDTLHGIYWKFIFIIEYVFFALLVAISGC